MSWIDQYIAWASTCTNAPAVYHRWGAYAALAAAAAKHVPFNYGPYRMTPNLYVIFQDGPESTAHAALTLSRRVSLAAGAHEIACQPSLDALLQYLKFSQHSVIYFTESNAWRWSNRAFSSFLADCRDGATFYRYTRGVESGTLENPCITMLGVATPCPSLMRYCIPVSAPARAPMLCPPAPDSETGAQLGISLSGIVGHALRFRNTRLSLRQIETPYIAWARALDQKYTTPESRPRAQLLKMTCLKLAFLEQLADKPSVPPARDALARAIEAIDQLGGSFASLDSAKVDAEPEDPQSRRRRRVASVIAAAGKISWSDLLRKTHLSRAALSEICQTLAESDLATITTIEPAEKGRRPTRFISWADARAQITSLNEEATSQKKDVDSHLSEPPVCANSLDSIASNAATSQTSQTSQQV